jgi:hypothetical protein
MAIGTDTAVTFAAIPLKDINNDETGDNKGITKMWKL